MDRDLPFLALTADHRFWDTEREVIFLGEWCLDDFPYEKIFFSHTMMDSPWNRQRNLDQTLPYLDSFSEVLLSHLSGQLSVLHDIELSPQSWRILIGNWVMHAVHMLYDRYLLLKEAMRIYGKFYTRIPETYDEAIPRTISDFKNAQFAHDTSLVLLGRIATILGVSCEYVNYPEINLEYSDCHQDGLKRLYSFSKRIVVKRILPLFNPGTSIVFSENALSFPYMMKLWRRGVFFADIEEWCPSHRNSVNMSLRHRIFNSLKKADLFQEVAIQCLPHILPSSLLEDFELWKSQAERISRGKKTELLVTSFGGSGNELFGIYAGLLLQGGCRLVFMQHGGGYGIFRHCPEELHETRCSDYYVTWGWKKEEKHHPMPSLHLSRMSQARVTNKNKKGLLFVTSSRPHLTHRIQSHPLTGQLSRYYAWQERFYEHLSDRIKSEFHIKLAVSDYHSRFALWWKNKSIISIGGPLKKVLPKFRLIVIDHNSTGYLESLMLNIPTVIFWDEELWELCDKALPYFRKLYDVGIFHKTPDSAAKHINSVFGTVHDWWSEDKLQKSRMEFCKEYAFSTNEWEEEWDAFLHQLST